MCLAIPGKIIEIKGDTVIVKYLREIKEAKILNDEYKIGDYVLVNSQIVIQKIPEEQALLSLKAWKEMLEKNV